MERQPKVSVIIPAYNAERYIGALLDSMMHQTMQNFELLIIDDGSTDHTRSLCMQKAKQDGRIVVVSQENAGPSAARNRGLEMAQGKYIAFADADDLCDRQWLEKMQSSLEKHGGELAMCNWVELQGKTLVPSTTFPEGESTRTADQFVPALTGLGGAVWNKLFLKDIIDRANIRFDVAKNRSEDFLFVAEYLCYVHRIVLVKEPLYTYRVVTGSLSHIQDRATLYWEICEGQRQALQIIQPKAEPALSHKMRTYVIDTHIRSLVLMLEHSVSRSDFCKVADSLADYYGYMNRKQRLYFAAWKISPQLFLTLWKLINFLKKKRRFHRAR